MISEFRRLFLPLIGLTVLFSAISLYSLGLRQVHEFGPYLIEIELARTSILSA